MSPTRLMALGSLGLIVLAGCASGSKASTTAAATPPTSGADLSVTTAAPAAPAAAAGPTLALRASSLGQIVVDAKGMTVYMFDRDSAGSGKSACNAGCSSEWPAVTVTGAPSAAPGVSGTLATLTRTDGTTQVTLNGHPLYHFAGDKAPGDTNGNGFAGIWHVVKASAASATPPAATSAPSAGSAATSAPHNPPPSPTSAPTHSTPAPTSPPQTSPAQTSPPTTHAPVTTPYGY